MFRAATNAFTNKFRCYFFRFLGMKIGKNTYIGPNLMIISYVFAPLIEIGKRVAIAPNVTLVVSSGANNSSISKLYPRKVSPIKIADDAWIGTGVIINPGVEIGKCSIVGAGAVVTRDVPPYCVVAGNPAKVIKTIKGARN